MANYLTDDAICLRVHDFSETSQIVGLFTRRHGLVPLIAKGAKRPSKKNTMSGPLDLLTSGEVVFVSPKDSAAAGQLGTLAAWELLNYRRELRSVLPALNAAMVCAEVTTHLVHPHDPHEGLFEELEAALELLVSSEQRARAAVAYLKAILTASGYWPQFGACLACGKAPLDASVRFSPRAGGILCASGCIVEHAGVLDELPGRIAMALDRLPAPTVLRANRPERLADESALSRALELLLSQVEAISDKPLRTRYLASSFLCAEFHGERRAKNK
jgi:DNA repair protein RecO